VLSGLFQVADSLAEEGSWGSYGQVFVEVCSECGIVAAALASPAADVEPSVQLAANAAAGRWSAVALSKKCMLNGECGPTPRLMSNWPGQFYIHVQAADVLSESSRQSRNRKPRVCSGTDMPAPYDVLA
jgi:hypothetical protein